MSKRRNLTLAAALAAAAVPAALAFAQTQTQTPTAPEGRRAFSAETRTRLMEGRLAMAKTALNLTSEQAQLWAPVEQFIRSSAADRQQRRQELRAKRQASATKERMGLPDRVERASQRMAQRAEHLKAFNAVFRPFYDSLNDEQKVVAGVVLRQAGGPGMGGHRHRWASRRPAGEGPQAPQKQ